MAFFKSFQHNLPSVNISSILDSVSSRVDDLANAVSDVTYAVSDQLTEQVTTIINKVQDEEEGEHSGAQEPACTATAQEGKSSNKSTWQKSGTVAEDGAQADCTPSQLEWEWRDGCWRVKKTEAELAEEERRKKEEMELREKREQRRKERRQKQLDKEAMSQKTKEEFQEGQPEDPAGEDDQERGMIDGGDHRNGGEASQPPGVESDSRLCQERTEDEEEEKGEEEVKKKHPGGGNDEKESSKSKRKKSEKKKEKERKKGSKKSDESSDVEKKKGKGKKSKKKKKKDIRG